MMNESTDILRFHDVTIAADREYESGICNLNVSLAAGDLVVVLLETEQVRIPLADAAEGLVTPVQGTVTFLGEDWQTMTPDRAAAQRGKIGRVFEGESWFSGLNVDQNITLAQRHHTRRPVQEIEQEATRPLPCLRSGGVATRSALERTMAGPAKGRLCPRVSRLAHLDSP